MMSVCLLAGKAGVNPILQSAVAIGFVLAAQAWAQHFGSIPGALLEQRRTLMGDPRYYLFLPFFLLGVAMRNVPTIPSHLCYIIIAVGLAIFATGDFPLLGDYHSLLFQMPMLLAFCAALATWALKWLPISASAPIQFLGQESLAIYLWHMLPIMVARHFFSGGTYVTVCCMSVWYLAVALWFLTQVSLPKPLQYLIFGKSISPQGALFSRMRAQR